MRKVLVTPIIQTCEPPHGGRDEIKEGRLVKTFGTQWERVRFSVTPGKMRVGLALLSLVAMVFAGSAGEHWT
jgi:hypothetical protein